MKNLSKYCRYMLYVCFCREMVLRNRWYWIIKGGYMEVMKKLREYEIDFFIELKKKVYESGEEEFRFFDFNEMGESSVKVENVFV